MPQHNVEGRAAGMQVWRGGGRRAGGRGSARRFPMESRCARAIGAGQSPQLRGGWADENGDVARYHWYEKRREVRREVRREAKGKDAVVRKDGLPYANQ